MGRRASYANRSRRDNVLSSFWPALLSVEKSGNTKSLGPAASRVTNNALDFTCQQGHSAELDAVPLPASSPCTHVHTSYSPNAISGILCDPIGNRDGHTLARRQIFPDLGDLLTHVPVVVSARHT